MPRKRNSTATAAAYQGPRLRGRGWWAGLPLLLLAACSTSSIVPPVQIEARTEAVKRFHPPLPPAVHPPGRIEIVVVTPDVSRQWNAEIEDGERLPYTIFGATEQDWLTLGRWQQDVLRYVEQLRAVVEFYRAERDLPAAGKAE